MVSLHSSVECVQLVCWDLLAAETLALGQLCFCCWAGRSKFFFFLHYETHSTDPTNAEVSRVGCFFSLSCQSSAKEGGLTQPRRGGLELGWVGHSPRIPWNMPGDLQLALLLARGAQIYHFQSRILPTRCSVSSYSKEYQ